jgi:hypothetical protein
MSGHLKGRWASVRASSYTCVGLGSIIGGGILTTKCCGPCLRLGKAVSIVKGPFSMFKNLYRFFQQPRNHSLGERSVYTLNAPILLSSIYIGLLIHYQEYK